MDDIGTRIGRGAAGGAIATLAMSAFMIAANRLGWLRRQAPEQVTHGTVSEMTGHHPRGATLDILASVAHVAFGAAGGAAYALSMGRWRLPSVPRAVAGVLFGTAVWIGAYVGVLPSVGLMPPPSRDEEGRPLTMVVAHWIYGSMLAVLVGRR